MPIHQRINDAVPFVRTISLLLMARGKIINQVEDFTYYVHYTLFSTEPGGSCNCVTTKR